MSRSSPDPGTTFVTRERVHGPKSRQTSAATALGQFLSAATTSPSRPSRLSRPDQPRSCEAALRPNNRSDWTTLPHQIPQ
eukprot:4767428-Prymnesium_polylepis.1